MWSGEQGPPGLGGGSPASLQGEGEGAIHSLPLKGEGCGAGVRSLQRERSTKALRQEPSRCLGISGDRGPAAELVRAANEIREGTEQGCPYGSW